MTMRNVTEDSERSFGEAAKQTVKNPANTMCDRKRLIGREFADPIQQGDSERLIGDTTKKPDSRNSENGANDTKQLIDRKFAVQGQ